MSATKKTERSADSSGRSTPDQEHPPNYHARPRAVILTALPVEYAAVRVHLSDLHEQTHEQGTVYEEGTFRGEQVWDVVLVEIGAGNAKTAAEAERAMQHFRPRVLLFVGIAGGLKDVEIGDIVVATKVYGYESGKAESEFLPRPHVFTPSYRLEQRARAAGRKIDWMKRLESPADGLKPRVFLGAIATGEKVVASRASEISRFIQENYGDSLAIEMEGHGLLEAASINEQVEALVVRGISDLLDRKSQSDAGGSQQLAATHASAFAFEILANIASLVDLPKYPPVQAQPVVRVVDVGGKGDHRTITEAIEAATPGEQISIKAGLYEESIVLNKALELFGDGQKGDIVVQWGGASCLSFRATMGRVSNITFRQLGITEEPCVDILQGRLELETCNISSQGAVGIAIHNGADPRIRYSNVHDNKKAGIAVFADGLGTVEKSTIFHNGGPGIASASVWS